MVPFTPPAFGKSAFNCPHCQAYSKQSWQQVFYHSPQTQLKQAFPKLLKAECGHCGHYSLWHEQSLLYPDQTGVVPPNVDLEESIKKNYLEAAAIAQKSSRGAAALLRLCIQKLCVQLGEKGKNINTDIANLISKGLPKKVQKALDILRVTGNNAVHPGEMILEDNKDIAFQLFSLINLIADVMLTQPKQIDEMYDSLPDNAKTAIEVRDADSQSK